MKKQITIYFTIFFFSIANSQKINGVKISPLQNQYSENDSIPKVIYGNEREAKKSIILLNNKYVASEVLNTLNSDKIESVTVEKGKVKINNTEYRSKIIVKTKSDYSPNLINIKDLISKYAKLENEKFIFSIDGEIINADQNLMMVDEKNIMQIKVVKLDNLEYAENLYFIKLLTRTKGNLKKANTIYIRGNELGMIE